MAKPFDYVQSINKGVNLLETEDSKDYVPFLTNRAMSFHVDAILHAQEMNLCAHMPNNLQFLYYLHSLKPRNRFGWLKAEKNEDLIAIQTVYQVNKRRAAEILKVLSEAQLDHIRKIKKVINDEQYNGSIR